jgi:hypothetical protein
LFRLLASFAALFVVATGVRAEPLLAVTFGNQLISIESTTGVGTLIGPLSSSMAPFGLGFRGSNLYTYDQQADLIRQLNPATGATIASINIGAGNLIGEGAIDFRSDGVGFLSTSNGPTGNYSASMSRFRTRHRSRRLVV